MEIRARGEVSLDYGQTCAGGHARCNAAGGSVHAEAGQPARAGEVECAGVCTPAPPSPTNFVARPTAGRGGGGGCCRHIMARVHARACTRARTGTRTHVHHRASGMPNAAAACACCSSTS
ncbi:hypothetical protein EON67_10750 [archaeon]|nr:MAG: hypothetical protein EON67_10750 [archaeon]